MKKPTYIAFTLGPLLRTLLNAQKTRELWGASYLFSWIMRRIMESLIARDAKFKEKIIMPSTHLLSENRKELYGAGMYGDRFYLEATSPNDKDLLREVIQEVLAELAGKMLGHNIKHKEAQYSQIQQAVEFVNDYFTVYAVQKELDEGANIINTLSPFLDTLELQANYQLEEKGNVLSKFLFKINKSFLIKDGFGQEKRTHPIISDLQVRGFTSIPEITTRELGQIPDLQSEYGDLLVKYFPEIYKESYQGKRFESKFKNPIKEEDDSEKHFFEALSQTPFKDYLRAHHKYIAIVQADGDNMGKIIETVGRDAEKLRKLQQGFLDFAHKAAEIIHKYGGAPIFGGGDDLMFFAPIVVRKRENSEQRSNIFELLKILDKYFQDYFKEYDITPTLSFGLSITYAKFPMGEALGHARQLLFNKAKSFPDKNAPTKNAVSFQILKHSGYAFGATVSLQSKYFEWLLTLITTSMESEDSILRSITYKIRENKALFDLIGIKNDSVQQFLENSFDERLHKNQPYKTYLENISKIIPAVYQENKGEEDANNRLYALLKTVHFFNEKTREDA